MRDKCDLVEDIRVTFFPSCSSKFSGDDSSARSGTAESRRSGRMEHTIRLHFGTSLCAHAGLSDQQRDPEVVNSSHASLLPFVTSSATPTLLLLLDSHKGFTRFI